MLEKEFSLQHKSNFDFDDEDIVNEGEISNIDLMEGEILRDLRTKNLSARNLIQNKTYQNSFENVLEKD